MGKRPLELCRMNAFRDFINACGLMDLESKGCAFTWANNHEGQDFVKERLERAICNIDWRVSFSQAKAFALLVIGSNHSPILLLLSAEPLRRNKMFKYEAFWILNEDCRRIVKQTWNHDRLQEYDLVQM